MNIDENGNVEMDLECPYCYYRGGRLTKGHTGGKRNEPVEGDPSMCVHCGEVSVFDARLNLRPLSDDDWSRFDAKMVKMLSDAKLMWETVIKPTRKNEAIYGNEKRS